MSKNDLQKHTLRLRAGDMDALARLYGPQGVSPTVLVRSLIARFVDSKLNELQTEELTDENLDFDLEAQTDE